jgi:stearoyl-CoA desaturase (Delta-9 desaturase)
MLKNVFLPAFFVLIVYPLVLVALGVSYHQSHTISWLEVGLFVAGYYGSNISVGVGLHRLWSHNAFKVNKVVEFFLILLSAGTLQGPALAWASDHHKHHTYTDKDQDPHSPLKYRGKLKGFLWSHMGWMLVGEAGYKTIDRVTLVKLGRNKLLKWQLKYYWQLAWGMNTIVPALVGYLIGGTLISAYAGFLFIGLGRALQQQATFCVNSLCHFLGSKEYYNGTAGDIWWFAPFLLGENWHNFHHAFPSDYRNGFKWYQFDVHKWIIFLLYKLGLASNLETTSAVRILAKAEETQKQTLAVHKEQLSILRTKAAELAAGLKQTYAEIENSSILVKKNISASFLEAQESLMGIIEQLQVDVQINECPERLLKAAKQQLKMVESTIYNLYNKLEKYSFSNPLNG